MKKSRLLTLAMVALFVGVAASCGDAPKKDSKETASISEMPSASAAEAARCERGGVEEHNPGAPGAKEGRHTTQPGRPQSARLPRPRQPRGERSAL